MTPRAKRRAFVGALVAALVPALAMAPGAWACSCAQMSPAERFAESDAAVVLRLTEVVESGPADEDVRLRYLVRRVYKGPPSLERGDTITLGNDRASSCALRERRRTALYLHGRAGRWGAGTCSETGARAMRRAAEKRAGQPGEKRSDCA